MDSKEFEVIVNLITFSEQRLVDKINDVNGNLKDVEKNLKNDIKDVQVGVTKINGRLREVELKAHDIEKDYEKRVISCDKRFDRIFPSLGIVNQGNSLIKHPKKTLIGFIIFIVLIQYAVLKLSEHDLIELLISKIFN